MNQERIGKFITECRKNKKLTQEQLAEKLGVSNKSISRWENGKTMPDVSLFKPLCEILDISVNEFINGEKIKENVLEKADENLIKTIDYGTKRIRNTKLIFISVFSILVILIISVVSLFLIDVNRMRNDEPVFFSTWGFKYAPPVNLDEINIEKTIKDYLIKEDEKINHYDNEKSFVALQTYLIDEKNNPTIVYAWVIQEKYYQEDKEVKLDTTSSLPYKFSLTRKEKSYLLKKAEIPRDGSYYDDDMKKLFPREVRKRMDEVYNDGTVEQLKYEIAEQVSLYYK